MPKLNQKTVQSFLSDIPNFDVNQINNLNLQQYMSPPFLAAKLLLNIIDIEGLDNLQRMSACQLGVGTGMLMCGLVYIGVSHVVGFEIDEKYAYRAKQTLDDKVEGGSYQIILADVKQLHFKNKVFDLVLMNPPFGTKEQGIDSVFLVKAMECCRGAIYSMHKDSTYGYLQKLALKHNYKIEKLFVYDFPLPKKYNKYHKKDMAYVQVCVIRLFPKKV